MVMALVIFFISSVESCGNDYGTSSREEEVCRSSPKKEKEYDGGNHGISSRDMEVCRFYS